MDNININIKFIKEQLLDYVINTYGLKRSKTLEKDLSREVYKYIRVISDNISDTILANLKEQIDKEIKENKDGK